MHSLQGACAPASPVGRNLLLNMRRIPSFYTCFHRRLLSTFVQLHVARATVKLPNKQWLGEQPSSQLSHNRMGVAATYTYTDVEQGLGRRPALEKLFGTLML